MRRSAVRKALSGTRCVSQTISATAPSLRFWITELMLTFSSPKMVAILPITPGWSRTAMRTYLRVSTSPIGLMAAWPRQVHGTRPMESLRMLRAIEMMSPTIALPVGREPAPRP